MLKKTRSRHFSRYILILVAIGAAVGNRIHLTANASELLNKSHTASMRRALYSDPNGADKLNAADSHPISTVTVHYPLSIGQTGKELYSINEWEKKAHYSPQLQADCDSDRQLYLSAASAQSMEDVWLFERWFYGVQSGIIVESGAVDGIFLSTSHMFEKIAGWTAIHVGKNALGGISMVLTDCPGYIYNYFLFISYLLKSFFVMFFCNMVIILEAEPGSYHNLVKNRPGSINVHAALCSEPKMLHFISRGAGGTVNGIVEFMPQLLLKKFHPNLYYNPSLIEKLPTVPCLTGKKMFEMLNVRHVDIWVLDVEGAEESVLQGMDFSAVQIDTICMECDGKDEANDQRKVAILEANGYICELVFRNCMCRRKDFSKIHTAPVLTDVSKKLNKNG